MKDYFRKKPELLAPAGNYESFLAAVNAGADAVYFGGTRFGARAYADNFDTEHVVRAIDYAHLYGCRVYMTVNTLVKEKEFDDLYDFLRPYADAGLDGVIVQDFGVFSFIREHFPQVEIHTSTQMAVSGVYGARLMKKLGAVRVVPARELSLKELRQIREEADIEVEAFIHGAMCYCYSGMCLFSSIAGGRSGNRGRCAQPCRLPYTVYTGKDPGGSRADNYPLSLKDMCTLELLPGLIDAGIDSFKIEGRMKRPEYTAGVTSVYRKYIDRYCNDPKAAYRVDKADMEMLRHLYMRTGISTGYLEKHNGAEMVTMTAPGYAGNDDRLLKEISDRYMQGEKSIPVSAYAYFHEGEESMLVLGCRDISVTVKGQKVEAASSRPAGIEDIAGRLMKLGGTFFELRREDLTVDMSEDGNGVFIPVKELNELRRRGVSQLLSELLHTV